MKVKYTLAWGFLMLYGWSTTAPYMMDTCILLGVLGLVMLRNP